MDKYKNISKINGASKVFFYLPWINVKFLFYYDKSKHLPNGEYLLFAIYTCNHL